MLARILLLFLLVCPSLSWAAAGETLLILSPLNASFPTSNFATLNTRNTHVVLNFDTTTQETAYFDGLVMPQHYAGGNITVYVHHAATSATTGTIGWDITFERIGNSQQDIDSDGFATAQTITAATVPGISGYVDIVNVAITAGATGTDSVAAGEGFRLRVRRDVLNDDATDDAQLWAIELRES